MDLSLNLGSCNHHQPTFGITSSSTRTSKNKKNKKNRTWVAIGIAKVLSMSWVPQQCTKIWAKVHIFVWMTLSKNLNLCSNLFPPLYLNLSLAWSSNASSKSSSNSNFCLPSQWSMVSLSFPRLLPPLTNTNAQWKWFHLILTSFLLSKM